MVIGKVQKAKQRVLLENRRQYAPIVDDFRFWQRSIQHGDKVEGTLVKIPGTNIEAFRLSSKYLSGNLPRSSKTGYRRLGKK